MNKFLFTQSILLAIFVSCSDADPSARKDGSENVGKCLTATNTKSWQSGIGTIFQKNCGSCHPGSRPTDYASYSGVKGNISAEKSRIDNNSMPPGGLAQADKDAVSAWIAAGLPETDAAIGAGCNNAASKNAGESAPTLPPVSPNLPANSVLSWDGGIGAIFIASCGSCHNGTSQATNYGTYAGVKANITVELLRMNSGSMPPSGPLAASDLNLIKTWINAGMPKTDADIPTGPVSTPAPLIPTYRGGVAIIMAASCTSCHSAAGGTRPYLDTLNSVKSNFSNSMSEIKSGSMPRGSSKLPADQISLLQNWGTAPNTPYGQWAP